MEASYRDIDTALIHAGTGRILGSAVMPIFQSVSYAHADSNHPHKPTPTNLYSRPADTPNHKVLSSSMQHHGKYLGTLRYLADCRA